MEAKNLKDSLIVIILIICILGFAFFLGLSAYHLYRTVKGAGYYGAETTESISPSCQKFKDTYVVTVYIDNYRKGELKNIKCQLASRGGLSADKEEVSIPSISENSSDICEFYLKGEERIGPIRVRVTYAKESWLKYKEYSKIVEPWCTEEEPPVIKLESPTPESGE